MKTKDTLLFTALNLTASFASPLVSTGIQKRGSDFKDEVPGVEVADNICFVTANVTSLTGTAPTMDIDVVAEVGGVDIVVGSFAQFTAAGNQTIKIEGCPSTIKLVGTAGGTVTDFDAEFAATRLVD